jgi:predicted glycosyltransferase involved in capsule biosynthesis
LAKNDILLFCDGYMIFDDDLIENGLKIVRDVPWVAPMNQKFDLTWQASNQLMNMKPDVKLKDLNLTVSRKWGAERCRAGAMLMITKENFEKAGGFDERFLGWGFEDNAFMLSAEATIGSYVETDNIAYHLWHPLSINQYPDLTAKNRELYAEYFKHFEEGDLKEWRGLK